MFLKSKPKKTAKANPSALKGLIVAGGTGGHIVPGISLVLELHAQSVKMRFLSLEKNRNYNDFEQLQVPIHFYEAPPLPRKLRELLSFSASSFFLRRFAIAFRKAKMLYQKHEIDFVVGMGGYPMLPALLAARFLKLPYFLCEQNAVPGRASRFFAKKAIALFLNFPLQYKNKKSNLKTYQVGNPLRSKLLKKLSLSKKKKTVSTLSILVLGGSQGALQVNQMVSMAIPKLGPKYKWTIQCGTSHLPELRGELPQDKFKNVKIIGYTPYIEELYVQANLLVCRAGAGVLSEAICFGLPLLLIPYPYAKDAHQEANANYLAKEGAAIVFPQKDSQPDALITTIQQLKENPEKRNEMSKNALRIAHPHAGKKISSIILSRF